MRSVCGWKNWVLGAVLILATGAAQAEGEINVLYGKKSLDNAWDPLDGQTQYGISINIGNRWPVALAIDVLTSSDDVTGLFPEGLGGMIDLTIEGETLEIDIGVRKLFLDGGCSVEVIFKARNAGDAAAGAFDLKYQVWFIDDNGNNSGPLDGVERWPGIAAGEEARSDTFIPQSARLIYDLTDFADVVNLAIFVVVDEPSRDNPTGEVVESIDGINDNTGVYTSHPDFPDQPWPIFLEDCGG